MPTTTIALIQQRATENRQFNRSRGLERAREAAENGANIICFAELAFDPFYPQTEATATTRALAERIPGDTTEPFMALAKEYQTVIILNLFERDGDQTFDSSPLIDADGSLLGVTRMVHITDYPCFHEKGYYAPGDRGAPVYQTRFGNLGIAICYDRHFPEYWRALSLSGAEIIFVPQAGAVDEWPAGLYEAELQVASFQNGVFSALCNRVGEEPRLTFAGESFVCDPEGRVIARAARGTEEILYCDLDLDRVANSHAKRLFLPDRRPQLYPAWLGS